MLHPRLLAALLLLLVLASAAPDAAGEDDAQRVLLPESLALTPDGGTLVFSWRGDLWRVPSGGGAARRLTAHPARDLRPHVSPDGTRVAFVSDRSGTEQVYVMPLSGGAPEAVTQHSEGSRVYGWFPDGRTLLIRSMRDHDWRGAARLFRKPLALDDRAELLFDAECGTGSVSPDGLWIAFTRERTNWTRKGYRGPQASQLWLYGTQQKTYTRLSRGDHGELWPLWAGGKGLFYVSEEDGTWNLWRRDTANGEKTQVTFFEGDGVSAPTLSADRSTLAFRRLGEVYRLSTTPGAKPERVRIRQEGEPPVETLERRLLKRAEGVAFTDDAREIAFVAGGDLWVMDTELREPRRITNTPAEERDAVFAPDFGSIFFVSEAAGSPDIWRARRADETRHWWQNEEFLVTRVTEDPEVEGSLEIVPGGKRLAYMRGNALWTMDLDGGDRRQHVTSFAGLQWSFSPDAQWLAYAKPDDDFNWDVWIAPLDGSREPFNVSVHPDNDRDPAWSPDGKVLAFTGRRWTEETDVCYVWLRKADDEIGSRQRKLEAALKKMAGRKSQTPKAAPAPGAAKPPAAASADPLAGTWTGRLRGSEPVPPDGLELSLVVTRDEAGTYAAEVEVVGQFSGRAEALTFDPAAGTLSFSLATPLGTLEGEGRVEGERMRGTWRIEGLMDGTYEVARKEAQAAPAPEKPAPQPAKPKPPAAGTAVEPVRIDFDDLVDRVHRISIPDSSEGSLLWSPDGKKLAFRASVGGKSGLYTVQFPDQLSPKLLTTLRGDGARWIQEGNQICWMVGGLPATLGASGKATSYGFSVRQEIVREELHAAAFEQAWRVMRDNYYDPAMGGSDWNAVRSKYAPLAARCATADELELVVNLMLGELNGSHLGFRSTQRGWSAPGWRDVTGHLGCRFDPEWDGAGLKVRDVVPGTPADQAATRIEPGERILDIDGRPVGPATNLAAVLTGDPDRTVEVRVQATDGAERTVVLRPTSYGVVRRRLYDHSVRQTRRQVEEASGGTLGYLHVRSMDWSSFLRFEAELYKVGYGKDGLIIDVRDNGGGFTTDHLLTCLTQPRHAVTVPRDGGLGYPQDRMIYAPWSKPIVVLCNQNSFSNAEIFAHAIKTLGRGPLVGVQTAGGVISTGGTMIMGLGSLRLPFRGWFRLPGGEDMELAGCAPQHVVWPHPSDLAAGRDRQVEKAIEVGLAEVEAWRKRPQVKPQYASQR